MCSECSRLGAYYLRSCLLDWTYTFATNVYKNCLVAFQKRECSQAKISTCGLFYKLAGNHRKDIPSIFLRIPFRYHKLPRRRVINDTPLGRNERNFPSYQPILTEKHCVYCSVLKNCLDTKMTKWGTKHGQFAKQYLTSIAPKPNDS